MSTDPNVQKAFAAAEVKALEMFNKWKGRPLEHFKKKCFVDTRLEGNNTGKIRVYANGVIKPHKNFIGEIP